MYKNRITVTADFVDGSVNDILSDVTPKQAIENYFFPDSRPPVSAIYLSFVDENGKVHKITITQQEVVYR
ncbi:MAG TPA: hypothetical protein VJY62_18985 [Bacteroidia bacterium]|nr:hypothetical protein [Bacteroidia bacterium]